MERLDIERILHAGRPPAAAASVIGESRLGRPLLAWDLGSGRDRVSLIGGAHADEPVGPEMLRKLLAWLAALPDTHPLLTRWRWRIVPHVNPDGAARNSGWPARTAPLTDAAGEPDTGYLLSAHFEQAIRERPGDDLEFGFPRTGRDHGARPEARAVADFMAAGGPVALHGSFHSMAFGAGPWFLLEPAWIERTRPLRSSLRERVAALGYRLHDVDRQGEKGFVRIDEGFCTRPDSDAMRRHFLDRGDPDTAALFRPSSMECARSLGGDPLTFVSEMPLFLVPRRPAPHEDHQRREPPVPPLDPAGRRRFAVWAGRILREHGPDALDDAVREAGIRPMPLRDQMRLQLGLLDEALATAGA